MKSRNQAGNFIRAYLRLTFAGLVLAWFFSPFESFAQNKEQVWTEFQLFYPFANRYLLETTAAYHTVLSRQGKWRSVSVSPTLHYSISRRFDLLAELPVGYTNQTESVSTFEITPMVGTRFHITQGKRVDARLVWRYQVRKFYEIETSEWQTSNRSRLRAEVLGCLNGPNVFTDGVFYLFFDYEEFFVLDQQLDERFANRRRGRIGLGYRFNYRHRADISLTRQSARDELADTFTRNDNIIQVRYKLFLNRPTPSAGLGNN